MRACASAREGVRVRVCAGESARVSVSMCERECECESAVVLLIQTISRERVRVSEQ